jgi:hypothetical protein
LPSRPKITPLGIALGAAFDAGIGVVVGAALFALRN